jgi:peptide/nickel transport system substrate-binding protein
MIVATETWGCTKVEMTSPSGAAGRHRHSYTIAHTLRIGDPTEYASLNPYLDLSSWRLADLTMAWLLRSGPDDRPRPELATEVPTPRNGGVSSDGRTIVYHLRHDARWSDGAQFTARDVVFSTKTGMDPQTDEQARDFFADIAGVGAPDPYTVVLHLKRPYAGIVYGYFFSVGSPSILPAHILARLPNINTASYNALPVGIGPFKYVRWDRGSQIVLAANPLYFRGKPKLDRIIVKSLPSVLAVYGALRSHAIDLANWHPSLSGGIDKDREFSTLVERLYETSYLTLNVRRPPLDDVAVRRALRLAIDRPRILQIITEGNVSLAERLTDSPYPAGHPMDTGFPLLGYDPAAANRLLERDGWHLGADGIRVKNGRRLSLAIPGPAGFRIMDQLDELLRSDLRDIGAVAETHNYAQAYLMSPAGPVARGDFDMFTTNFDFDAYGDLSSQFGCDRAPPNGWDVGGYCNRSLEPLLAAFNAAYQESARRRLAGRIARKIIDDVPVIPLRAGGAYWIFNTDLRRFRPNRTSFYDDFMNVDI